MLNDMPAPRMVRVTAPITMTEASRPPQGKSIIERYSRRETSDEKAQIGMCQRVECHHMMRLYTLEIILMRISANTDLE